MHRVNEERNILETRKRRKVNWACHILRKNLLLKEVVEGRIEVMGRRIRRRKQMMYDLKEIRIHWKLEKEALDRSLCRSRFGGGHGPVVRQDYGMMTA